MTVVSTKTYSPPKSYSVGHDPDIMTGKGARQSGGKKFKDTKFGKAVKKGNAFLKKTKILSEVAGAASDLGVRGADRAGRVLTRAGYGKQIGGAKRPRREVFHKSIEILNPQSLCLIFF